MKKNIVPVFLAFIILSSSLLFSGCALFKSVGIPPSGRLTPQYAQVLQRWTRKADVYNHLNTVMYIRATYFTEPFVRKYVKEYAGYYMLSEKAESEKLGKLAPFYKQYITIFVSVYTPKKSYNDLSPGNSIWQVYLVNGEGEAVMPESVKLSRQKKVVLKKFFPYVTDWSKQYIIKFPVYYDKKLEKLFLSGGAKYIKLVITGVNGKAVLKWDLR